MLTAEYIAGWHLGATGAEVQVSRGDGPPRERWGSVMPLGVVGGDMVVRVFGDVDFDEVAGAVEQAAAVFAEVSQVQLLTELLVAGGKGVDGLEARLVVDAGEVEVDDDIVGVG